MKAKNTEHSNYTLRYEFFVLGTPDGYREEIFSSYEEASNKGHHIASYDIGGLVIGNITINGKPLEW